MHEEIIQGRPPKKDYEVKNIEDSQFSSPFSEKLISERTSLINLSSVYPISDLRNITTGTVNVNTGEYEVTAGATLESAEIGRYMPGYGAEVGVGIRLGATLPGSAQWGYYDDDDGVFFKIANGDLQAGIRHGASDVLIDRADFNVDKLDGNGPSGLTWGPTTANIYQIRFSWYGYGQVEWSIVGIHANGLQRVYPVHRRKVDTATSIESPNLPIKVECATSGSVYVGGRQMSIVGKYRPNQRITSARQTGKTVSTTWVPLCSFRRKDAVTSKNVSIIAEGLSILTDNDIEVAVLVGASLTGASWGTPIHRTAGETAIEVDSSASSYTGGETIWHELVDASGPGTNLSGSVESELDVRIPRLEPVTLIARRFSADATVRAVLRCSEAW